MPRIVHTIWCENFLCANRKWDDEGFFGETLRQETRANYALASGAGQLDIGNDGGIARGDGICPNFRRAAARQYAKKQPSSSANRRNLSKGSATYGHRCHHDLCRFRAIKWILLKLGTQFCAKTFGTKSETKIRSLVYLAAIFWLRNCPQNPRGRILRRYGVRAGKNSIGNQTAIWGRPTYTWWASTRCSNTNPDSCNAHARFDN